MNAPPSGDHPALPGLDLDLPAYLSARQQQVNQALVDILGDTRQDARLVDAMTYSVMAGGKRLRPILCLASAGSVGDPMPAVRRQVLQVACALELIHTYSLIHDDLPAMDNDDLRRGKPTCHVAYGQATAILAGDALLTLAFEVLSRAALKDPDRGPLWFSVFLRIARAAGRQGMIEGQMRDMAAEGARLSTDELEAMHQLKTGAIIEASVVAGAAIGGAGDGKIERLAGYARNIGLAFQVADDILNVEGDAQLMGKAVGTDDAQGKNTYPSLMGLDASKAYARELVHTALGKLDGFDARSDPLRALAVYIVERKK